MSRPLHASLPRRPDPVEQRVRGGGAFADGLLKRVTPLGVVDRGEWGDIRLAALHYASGVRLAISYYRDGRRMGSNHFATGEELDLLEHAIASTRRLAANDVRDITDPPKGPRP